MQNGEPGYLTADIYQKATWLGIVAGLRSMTPAALLAWSSNSTSSTTKTVTGFLAAGEIIADKLPFTPSRLQPGPFVGRLVVGAVSGAILCRRAQQSGLQGALRGAIGAALGSVAGYVYRSAAANVTDVSDVIWAVIEDGTALALGARATGLTGSDTTA